MHCNAILLSWNKNQKGYRMKRFVGWIQTFAKYQELFGLLVKRDIKAKYRRSFLGYIWSVLNPLLTMIVMWMVFSNLFKSDIPFFPVYLLTGQVMFNFMSEATNLSMGSILGNSGLIKKTYMPKYLFPLSKITSSLVNMLFSLGALLIVIIITGVPFTFRMLLFWVPILELYFFCIGLGLFLAQGSVFFRDLQYIWSVLLVAWTYLTPIFYPASILNDELRLGMCIFNPMYSYVMQFRNIILYNTPLDFSIIVPGLIWMILLLLLGIRSFVKNQDHFILYI